MVEAEKAFHPFGLMTNYHVGITCPISNEVK